LGLWTLLLFYNVTEASFELTLLLVSFLFAAIHVPERAEDHLPTVRPVDVELAELAGPLASIEMVRQAW